MLLRSCAIWRENEREVTVMKQYILDTRMGTIQEEPIQGKMGWDGTENQQENTCLILAATLKEFEASEILHPCKKELLHSLNCLMKVSYYLNDNNNYQYYKKELLSIINQELDNYNFDLPIVCHGYASVLSIQISAFRESGDKSFLITRERNMRQTIISHRNCIFNDEYTNDYSILSGESGTILTLINGIYLGKEYPKLLMID